MSGSKKKNENEKRVKEAKKITVCIQMNQIWIIRWRLSCQIYHIYKHTYTHADDSAIICGFLARYSYVLKSQKHSQPSDWAASSLTASAFSYQIGIESKASQRNLQQDKKCRLEDVV